MLVGAHGQPVRRGEALLAWYGEHRRDLPWRRTSDPYRILVSEVMLQQTQVARVAPRYEVFLCRFPTPSDLASSSLTEVLDLWTKTDTTVVFVTHSIPEAVFLSTRVVVRHGLSGVVPPGFGSLFGRLVASRGVSGGSYIN